MRFLIHGIADAEVAAAVVSAVVRHGHKATTAGEAGLAADLDADDVLAYARKAQLDVMTGDAAVGDYLYGAKEEGLKVKFGRSVVFYQLKGGAVELDDAVDRLFTRYKAPSPGRYYTVTETRVKVRQLPGE
jgi:hypothetical protein